MFRIIVEFRIISQKPKKLYLMINKSKLKTSNFENKIRLINYKIYKNYDIRKNLNL